jgi:hypothetical protein
MKIKILLLLIYTSVTFAQRTGNYRSANSGNWVTLNSWEYYDGTSWEIPSNTAGYPGQFSNTQAVLIQPGHTITIEDTGISTQPFELLTINGSLFLNGEKSKETFFTIKAHSIVVTPGLTPAATIEFQNKGILQLPADGSLQVTTGGLAGDCSNNQSIYIGDFEYSVCAGGGAGATFDEVMEAGGTLNTVPTSNSPLFAGESIYLTGNYIGPPGENLSFEWIITDPLNNSITTTEQNTSVPNAMQGVYTAKLTCFTTYNGMPYSNYETINIIVNLGQALNSPVAISGSGATCNEIIANWEQLNGSITYYLDVATDIEFNNFVTGYNNLNVGNTLSKKITGLINATTYYYRVNAYDGTNISPRSNTISYATLTTPNGLTATVTAQPSCTLNTGTVTLNSPYLQDTRYEYNADGGPYQTSNVFTGLASGAHTFTVRFLGEDSCTSDPAIAIINNLLELPIANAGDGFIKTCIYDPSGKQIGTDSVAGVTYSWAPTLGLSDSTISNPIANPTATTNYTLTATQTAGGCTATDTVLITVDIELPVANAGPDLSKTCVINPTGTIIGTSFIAGNTYSWSPQSFLSNSGIAQPFADPTSTTTYTVTASDVTSGCTATDSMTLMVNKANPSSDAGTDFKKTCTVNLNGKQIGTTPFSNTTYSWTPTAGLSNSIISNPIANPSVSTTYTLTTTSTITGCTATDTVLVSVDTTPPPAIAGNDFTKTCVLNPNGTTIGTAQIAGVNYNWIPITGLSNATVSNPTANPVTTTTYTLTTTNIATGCINTDTALATVNTIAPIANAGTDFAKTCTANPLGAKIGMTAESGNTYNWSPSEGLSSTTIADPIASPTTTTTYTLTVTNTASGCTATDLVTITVDVSPPSANAGTDFIKTCVLNPTGASLGGTAISELTYNWSPAAGLSSATVSNPIANPDSTTAYTLTTTATANGCTNSDAVLVTVNTALPIADAGVDFTKTCIENPSGKSIGATTIIGNTYNWSPNTGLSNATISNPTANPITTTTYFLTVTGANGCTSTDTVTVNVDTTTSITNAGTDFIKSCSQNQNGAIIGVIPATGVTYLWIPSEGLSSTTIANPMANPITTTTYILTATNTSNGCSNTDSVLITVDTTNPIADAGADFTKTCLENPSGKTIGIAAVIENSYNWSPSKGLSSTTISNPTANPSATTTYTLTVTGANGCFASDSITVTVNNTSPNPNAAGADKTTNCNTPAATIGTASEAGTDYSWSPTTGLVNATISNPIASPSTTQIYTVTATNTASGCFINDSVKVTVDKTIPIANAGTDFTKTCITNSSGVEIGVAAVAGTAYSWNPTTGLSSATVSNPTANPSVTTTYTLTATGTNGCLATDQVTVTVNTSYPNPNAAGVDKTVNCTTPSVSIGTAAETDTNYSWSPTTGLSNANDSNPSATPLLTITYTLTATNTVSGCFTTDNVIVTADKTLPSPPTTAAPTQPNCDITTGSVVLSGLPTGNWTITQNGTATTTINGSGSAITINGLSTGNYTFTVTNASGCTSAASANVGINTQPLIPTAPTIGTVTDPTCTTGGSVVLNNLPATGTWTLNQIGTSNTTTTGSGSTATISGLLPGTYHYVVVSDAGCISPVSADLIMNSVSSGATLGTVVHPTCATPTGMINFTNLPPTGWVLTRTNPDSSTLLVTEPNPSPTTYTTPPLIAGVYNFSLDSGPICSAVGGNVTLNPQPSTPIVPTVAITANPSCGVSETTLLVSNLPSDNWTIQIFNSSNALVKTITGTGTTYSTSGIFLAGDYTIAVTNEQECSSPRSTAFTIITQPLPLATPTIGTKTQPICGTPTGTVVINNLPASGTWTLNQSGTVNNTYTNTGTTFTVPALTQGFYNFTVSGISETCESGFSATVTINKAKVVPPPPTIGTVTQPTCESNTGSIKITDLPTGAWTLYSTPSLGEGTGLSGVGTTAFFTNIPSGNYTITVKNSDDCISAPSTTIEINTQPLPLASPTIGTTNQPICGTPTGSVLLNDLPATGTWILTQSGTVNSIYSGTGTSFFVSSLNEGFFNFTVSGISGNCESDISATVTIDKPKIVPDPPVIGNITQPSCNSSTGTVEIKGLPIGNWTLFTSPAIGDGTGLNGSGTSAILTGNVVGTYTVTVKNSDGCTSSPSVSFTLITQPPTLEIPTLSSVTPPNCTVATGIFTITNYDSNNIYTVNPNTGVTILGNTITAPRGNYTVTATSGGCTSSPSAVVTVSKQPETPIAPSIENIIQPTCTSNTGGIEINGLPVDSWTLFASPVIGDGSGLNGTGTTAILTGAVVGTYTVTVKNSDGCTSASSTSFTFNAQPPTPVIPTLSTVTPPTCSVATGSFTITNYDSNNIYTINPNTGVTISGNMITAPRGIYTVKATSGGCTSNESATVKINKQPKTPTAPLIGTITQPTCISNKGSVELNGLPIGTWTLFASPAIGDGTGLNGSGTTTILTGVVVGTYTVTVKNADGCSSPTSLTFTLNEQPITPDIPVLSTPIQPSCTVSAGSFTITNYNSSYNYTVNPSTGVSLSENTIIAPKGSYTVTATLGSCSSGISSVVVIMAQPKTPTVPIIGNITQPSCNSDTGSIEISGLPADEWTLYSSPEIIDGGPGLTGIGTTAFYTDVPSGTYEVTVKNSDSCYSSNSAPFTVNLQPITPATPILSAPIQPNCTKATGSFKIINYDSNNAYTVSPNTGVTISADTVTAPNGSYSVLATLGSCSSETSEHVTIDPQPAPPTTPVIDFITQSTCESNVGSIGLSGLPEESWTLTSSGGRTLPGMGTTAILTGNSVPGTYTLTVTNAEGCTSIPSAAIELNSQPAIPNAPTIGSIIEPDCISTTGTIVISNPTEGSGYEYNIDGGNYQVSSTFTNVNSGLHTLTCRAITTGSCISNNTIVKIKDPLFVNTPLINSTIQPTCTTKGSILLEGLPTGNWTLYQIGTSTQIITGSGTSTTITGLEVGTYSYRVFDGTCLSKTTANILLTPLQSTAWTGKKWTNDLPNIDKYVYINGNYEFDKDTEMCTCQAITGLIHTTEGTTITIADRLEILKGSIFNFANTSSLVQINEVINIGKIIYNRFSPPVFQSDFVYWSAPVYLVQLSNAFPNTPSDQLLSFDANANTWEKEKPYNLMKISKGYSIGSQRGFYDQNIYSYPIHFIGVPNNGTITTQSIDEGKSYLIGNPYPSAVNADQFLSNNKAILNGTIYFWSHNPQSTTLEYASNDYAAYNATGGAGIKARDPITNTNSSIPLGVITAGQSFFAQGKEGVLNVKAQFNNTMRIGGNNIQFFKFNTQTKSSESIEKNRIWLNVYNSQGAFKQTLIGYVEGATNGYDSAFDGTVFNGNKYIDFYSINQGKNLTIQGRALPFDENDTVPLGFSTTIEGVFEINIDQTEGTLDSQDVYLEDKGTAVFYNLKKGSYRFNTSKGTFDKRFVLHYKKEVPNQEKLDKPVIVSVKDGVIKVNSFFEVMDKLEIYDITGRSLYKQENVNINEYYIQNFHSSDQPLIVKTFLKNGDNVATVIVYTSFGN